jgi:hypothetical protein
MVGQRNSHLSSKKQSRESGRGQGKLLSPGHTLSDLFLPIRLHLPIKLSYYKPMNGLIHSLDQSPQDLILSANTTTDTPRGVLY